MIDIPILFSAAMVQAELDDLKTMTRRMAITERLYGRDAKIPAGMSTRAVEGGFVVERPSAWTRVKTGDRLWVREDWRISAKWESTKPADLPPRTMSVVFDAGGSISNQNSGSWAPDRSWPPAGERPAWIGRRRASMHLPRWASRLTLVVTSTKIERLQDISESDAIAEGVVKRGDRDYWAGENRGTDAVAAFSALWRSLHGLASWEQNPDVVALTFRVVKANIDALEEQAA